MNEGDIQLMNKFLTEVTDRENGKRILLSVKYNRINKINLIILRALVQEQGKRGLFVTVDRPHKYMEYLLDLNKIPKDGLIFLDVISRFSGESSSPRCDVASNASPFKISELMDLMESGGGGSDARVASIDFGLLDFVMIDNLGAMLAYNELEDVSAFIQRYMKLIERYGRIFTAIVMDVRALPEFYRTIQGLCQREFLVSDDGNLLPLGNLAAPGTVGDKPKDVGESVLLFAPEKPLPFGAVPRPEGI